MSGPLLPQSAAHRTRTFKHGDTTLVPLSPSPTMNNTDSEAPTE